MLGHRIGDDPGITELGAQCRGMGLSRVMIHQTIPPLHHSQSAGQGHFPEGRACPIAPALSTSWELHLVRGFSGGSNSKQYSGNEGDVGSIPESGRSPEKGMATHSSILAWRITWTEEPGWLQSRESQRVGHNLAL